MTALSVTNQTPSMIYPMMIIGIVIFLILVFRKKSFNRNDKFIPDTKAPELERRFIVGSQEGVDVSATLLKYLTFRAEDHVRLSKKTFTRKEIELLPLRWKDDFRHSYYKTFGYDPEAEINYDHVATSLVRSLCLSGLLTSLKPEPEPSSQKQDLVLEEA